MLLTLFEEEAQSWKLGFLLLPFGAGLCPSTDGGDWGQQLQTERFFRERGWFPPGGVERVKGKGQVLKSGRMLKSPCSPPSFFQPHPFSLHPLPTPLSAGSPLRGDVPPGCKPGSSSFTPKLPGRSMYLPPQPMSSSICSNSPFPPISLQPPGVALMRYLFTPPYMWVDGERSWGAMLENRGENK